MEYNFPKFYKTWSFIHSIINLIGVASAFFLCNSTFWIIATSMTFMFYIFLIPKFLTSRNFKFGIPNGITLFRLLCILFGGLAFHKIADNHLFFFFLIIILLDGLDGYVARRYDQSSLVGEQFDMETDAFLVCLLSWIHVENNELGYWLLIPGSMRYLSEVLLQLIKFNTGDFPPKKVRSIIAVLFFISLLCPFLIQEDISTPIIIISSCLIFLSFASSFIVIKS